MGDFVSGGRELPRTVMVLALLVTPGVCTKLRPSKADGGASVSSATLASASALAAASAAASASAATSAAAAASAAAEAARQAALERAKTLVADIQWMVGKGVTVHAAKAGEGDVATKCDAVEATRSGLGSPPDPELVKVLEQGSALCAFDVPLLTASESLDHLRGTPSQASRLLMCNVASREIAKARAVHPNDPKVRRAEGRRATLCKK